jgi:hypothetical protein
LINQLCRLPNIRLQISTGHNVFNRDGVGIFSRGSDRDSSRAFSGFVSIIGMAISAALFSERGQ